MSAVKNPLSMRSMSGKSPAITCHTNWGEGGHVFSYKIAFSEFFLVSSEYTHYAASLILYMMA